MSAKPRMSTMLRLTTMAVFAAALASPVLAQGVTVKATFPQCIPTTANALVTAQVTPAGAEHVRVYFKRHGEKDYYFVEMRAGQAQGFWGVLPKPECGTKQVDMYVAAGEMKSEERTVDVRADKNSCGVTLTAEQSQYAQNLVIGETVPGQKDKAVLGFCCQGIVARLEGNGPVRPDQVCRDQKMAKAPCTCGPAAIVAASPWHKALPWVGLGAVVGGGVIAINNDSKTETSQARP